MHVVDRVRCVLRHATNHNAVAQKKRAPTSPSLCSKLLRLPCLADTVYDRRASTEVNMDRFVRMQNVELHWCC